MCSSNSFRSMNLVLSLSSKKIGEMNLKQNRRDELIMKGCLIVESLSSHDTLILENKQIIQDPKPVAFAQLLSKSSNIFDRYEGKDSGCGDGDKKDRKLKKGKKSYGNKKNDWKFTCLEKVEPKSKKDGCKTYHWCHKEDGREKSLYGLSAP